MRSGGVSSSFVLHELRGPTERSVLEHLGVAQADVHGPRRLLEGAGLEEPQLEDALIAFRQFGEDVGHALRCIALRRWLVSRGGDFSLDIDRADLHAVPTPPMRSEDGARGREEVRPYFAH